MSHTPEPWIFFKDRSNRVVVGPSTNYTAAICSITPEIDCCEANARRIVACVNACAGFNTGQLENVLLFGDTLEQRFMVLSNLETELRCQRDGLLLALEYAIRQHQGLATVQGIAMAIEAVKGTET